MSTAQASAATAVGADYPVQIALPESLEESQWWGIPALGVFVRLLLLIPHFLVFIVLGLGIAVIVLVGWIPILVTGRVPSMQMTWIKEVVHRGARVQSYFYLFPGGYPPLEPGAPGPVDVRFAIESNAINPLWGIPIIGLMVRWIVLIPHWIVLGLLGTVCSLGMWVLWIPILLNGRFPERAMLLYGGLITYSARVGSYMLLLPVPYPPFSLS